MKIVEIKSVEKRWVAAQKIRWAAGDMGGVVKAKHWELKKGKAKVESNLFWWKIQALVSRAVVGNKPEYKELKDKISIHQPGDEESIE